MPRTKSIVPTKREKRKYTRRHTSPPDAKPSILEEAQTIIFGDREQTYGHPEKNLAQIGRLWTAYFGGNTVVDANDVCNLMVLMKVARLQNTPGHRDSLVDICGYTALQTRFTPEAR